MSDTTKAAFEQMRRHNFHPSFVAALEAIEQDCDQRVNALDSRVSALEAGRVVIPEDINDRLHSLYNEITDMERQNEALNAKVSDLESQLAMCKEPAVIDEARWLEERNADRHWTDS